MYPNFQPDSRVARGKNNHELPQPQVPGTSSRIVPSQTVELPLGVMVPEYVSAFSASFSGADSIQSLTQAAALTRSPNTPGTPAAFSWSGVLHSPTEQDQGRTDCKQKMESKAAGEPCKPAAPFDAGSSTSLTSEPPYQADSVASVGVKSGAGIASCPFAQDLLAIMTSASEKTGIALRAHAALVEKFFLRTDIDFRTADTQDILLQLIMTADASVQPSIRALVAKKLGFTCNDADLLRLHTRVLYDGSLSGTIRFQIVGGLSGAFRNKTAAEMERKFMAAIIRADLTESALSAVIMGMAHGTGYRSALTNLLLQTQQALPEKFASEIEQNDWLQGATRAVAKYTRHVPAAERPAKVITALAIEFMKPMPDAAIFQFTDVLWRSQGDDIFGQIMQDRRLDGANLVLTVGAHFAALGRDPHAASLLKKHRDLLLAAPVPDLGRRCLLLEGHTRYLRSLEPAASIEQVELLIADIGDSGFSKAQKVDAFKAIGIGLGESEVPGRLKRVLSDALADIGTRQALAVIDSLQIRHVYVPPALVVSSITTSSEVVEGVAKDSK